MAAYGGDETALTMLLESGANPNLQVKEESALSTRPLPMSFSQDVNGLSALHMLAVEGHAHCVTTLVTHGADLNTFDFSEER